MELCIKIVDTGIEICYYLKSYAFVGGIMYWDEINMAFDEVRKASNTDEKRLSIFAEECHDRTYSFTVSLLGTAFSPC